MIVLASAPQSAGGVDAPWVADLASGAAFGDTRPERRIDTHAATIFLTADRAWKIKKPVNLGYLDFTTVSARHRALAAEDRLNRQTAAGLYRGLHPLCADGKGGYRLDQAGAPVDWVLEMRRFPDGALLSERAAHGGLDPVLLTALADGIARFHGCATIVFGRGGAQRFAKVVQGNAHAMARYPHQLAPKRVAALTGQISALAKALAPRLEQRGRRGHIRRCHGDLHLANIALIDGVPTPFDCLEFDEELAITDVLYDLAFLLMDLWHRGLRFEANLLANRYLDLAPAEEDAITMLSLFMAVRAQVRCHVAAARADQSGDRIAHADGETYLELAEALLRPARPRLVAIGGLSGTGKSTIARHLGPLVGRAPGARILRTDVLRKQAAHVALDAKLPLVAYAPDERHAVYEQLGEHAATILAGGQAVIADAVFSASEERAMIRRVASSPKVDFTGLWLEADVATRANRVANRGPDASDATPQLVHAQARSAANVPADWIRIDTSGAIDNVIAQARAAIGCPISRP